VEKKALVSSDRPLPEFMSPEIMGKDPFNVVVPLGVHQGAQRYGDRREQEFQAAIGRLRECTSKCVEDLLAMGLPASIQAAESPSAVPETLLKNAEEIRQSGGATAIEAKIQNVPSLSKTCRDMLDDAAHTLDQEERTDNEYRRNNGEKWTREHSDKIARPTRNEIDKYQTILTNAANSDRQVVEKYDAIRRKLWFRERRRG
jgi:programmed cell death 6-interacting protein